MSLKKLRTLGSPGRAYSLWVPTTERALLLRGRLWKDLTPTQKAEIKEGSTPLSVSGAYLKLLGGYLTLKNLLHEPPTRKTTMERARAEVGKMSLTPATAPMAITSKIMSRAYTIPSLHAPWVETHAANDAVQVKAFKSALRLSYFADPGPITLAWQYFGGGCDKDGAPMGVFGHSGLVPTALCSA